MKISLLAFLSFILSGINICNAQAFGWANAITSPTNAFIQGESITTDAAGNVYVTGAFRGTFDFDPGPGVFNLTSVPTLDDIFICKYNNTGNLVWAKAMGQGPEDQPYVITVDADGNVYTTGFFVGTSDFDPGPGVYPLTCLDGSGDAFISKLDMNGNFVWARSLGNTVAGDGGHGLSVDENGNVYCLGSFQYDIDVDPGPGVQTFSMAPTGTDLFLLKLDRDGIFVDARQLSYTTFDGATDLVVKNGYVYTLDYGGTYNYISKFDTSLVYQWVDSFPIWAKAINVDDAGNVIAGGSFNGSVDFDPGPGVVSYTASVPGDMFILKLNRDGNYVWVRTAGTATSQYEQVNDVFADQNGDIYATGTFDVALQFDPGNPASSLSPQMRDIFVEKISGTGEFQWVVNMGGTKADVGNSVAADNMGNVFTTGWFQGTADFNPDPTVAYNLSVQVAGTGSAIFVSKLSGQNHISGNAFIDINNDGTRQAGERPYPFLVVKAGNPSHIYYGLSDTAGNYNIYTDSGSYNISVPVIPAYYSITTSLPTASFNGLLGGIDSLNHIALYPQPNVNDLSVSVHTWPIPRPGRQVYMDVVYRNTGTTTLSGDVSLQHDGVLVYQSASEAPASYVNPLLTWNYANLQPLETRYIRVLFDVPSTLVPGTILHGIANIDPVINDSTPANNTALVTDTSRGSFDPNEKSVYPAGPVSTDFISSDSTFLDYVIRFQNTGNDTAYVVVITDTLQNTLDLATLKITASSHPCTVNIVNGNVLQFMFDNIMLPDSNSNELLSHGYVAFTVKPFTTLPVGTSITNTAAIYFDFNSAVITNEVVTAVTAITPLGLKEFNVTSNDCKHALISWSANSELNISYFTVEKSYDAVHWNFAGRLSSNAANSYYLDDELTMPGRTYYRLRQTTPDGKETYSYVRSLNCGDIDLVKLYPNPSKDFFIVESKEAFTYVLHDSKGSVVRKGSSDAQLTRISTTDLQPAVYILTMKTSGGTLVRKIVVE